MLSDYLSSLLTWLQLHPHLAGLATGGLCFLECCLVIGLFMPGIVVMTTVGTLIGHGILPFTTIIFWAVIGAILGDGFSFWLGYRYQQFLRDCWLFRHYPKLIQRGEHFFQRYGGTSIFIGRFVGPVRPLLPVIAGMVKMPVGRFLSADIVSALLWAPLYMLPGIFLGQASQYWPPAFASRLIILVILVLLLLLWLLSVVKSLYDCSVNSYRAGIAYLWHTIRDCQSLQGLARCLTLPHNPNNPQLLVLALLFSFSTVLALMLLYSITQQGAALAWNQATYYFMRSIQSPVFDPLFIGVTLVGTQLLASLWLVVLIGLIIQREFRTAVYWLVAGLLTLGGGALLKHVVHFPRPTGTLRPLTGWSFPSGHVLTNLVFLGLLTHWLTARCTLYCRWFSYSLLGLWLLVVMLARLYLSAHWLTDVIGSVLFGTSILTLLIGFYQRRPMLLKAPKGLLVLIVATLGVGWGIEAYYYDQQRQRYTLSPPQSVHALAYWWRHVEQQPPLYRTNRFGQPLALLNVQWVGSLTMIQMALEQQGWLIVPQTTLLNALYHPKNSGLLLRPSNAGKKAALVMRKRLPHTQIQLTLALWPADLKLENSPPLWVGQLSDQYNWQLHFQHLPEITSMKLSDPTQLMLGDLQHFTGKSVFYPSLQTSVLYIKPCNSTLSMPIHLK